MIQKSTFFSLLFACIFAFSQAQTGQNDLGIRLAYQKTASRGISSADLYPSFFRLEPKRKHHEFVGELSYHRAITKGFFLRFKLGYGIVQPETTLKENSIRSYYQQLIAEYATDHRFLLSAGVGKKFTFSKLELNIGPEFSVGMLKRGALTEKFIVEEEDLSSYTRFIESLQLPITAQFGVGAFASIYYQLTDNFLIGAEFNYTIRMEYTKGTMRYVTQELNSSGERIRNSQGNREVEYFEMLYSERSIPLLGVVYRF